jgi:hypothetical protein
MVTFPAQLQEFLKLFLPFAKFCLALIVFIIKAVKMKIDY